MKQVLQDLRSGVTTVADVPAPGTRAGEILIATRASLVSSGTERMLVDFGRAGWVEKARQQPDKVRMVLDKVRTDGLLPTIEAVRNKLDQPLALGYCNVGSVVEAGSGVVGFERGDRVVSNGRHAEIVRSPRNLCAKVPDSVPDDEAAFTVLAAIALQGVRLAAPSLGETVVVTGLGLIGLVTVQLLRANGCRVIGIDFDRQKLDLARCFGAEVVDLSAGQDPIAAAQLYTHDRGVDAVLITASTQSNEPVRQAALMCRKRGRIVLVGVAGLELNRADFYEKELSFQVSCSYGPGRYDPEYEDHGKDYPFAFVRWTEQRNFEAVLDLMSDRRLDMRPLISHRFSLDRAPDAYDLLASGAPCLGILLTYPRADESTWSELRRRTVGVAIRRVDQAAAASAARVRIGVVGAGNYATAALIPALSTAGAELVSVASSAGVTGVHAAQKFGFEETTTATTELLADPRIDAVVITTRHDSHADLAVAALTAGKSVFVEKPLCLTLDELERIRAARSASTGILTVGFNRRFAPHVIEMRRLLDGTTGPKSLVVTVNAGAIPAAHWTQSPTIGGGRIVGEACHFVDLLRFLVGHEIVEYRRDDLAAVTRDTASIGLSFADGSIGTIHYFANGARSFPKERVEVFVSGRVLQLDNFRVLRGFGWPGFRKMRMWRQDKGQRGCAVAFVNAVRAGAPPIPDTEIDEVARVTIQLGG